MTSRTTGISWCERTWNPVTGCAKISDGCKNCYAEKMAKRIALMGGPASTRYLPVIDTETGRWTKVVRTWPQLLDIPLRRMEPTTYFVGSMTDMFHKDVPFEFLAAVFAVMAASAQHRFMLLTKRPETMRMFFAWVATGDTSLDATTHCRARYRALRGGLSMARLATHKFSSEWPLPNVAIGTSVEHQAAADERIPILKDTPAVHRFLSCEPLLGPIVVNNWSGIDLVIIGCESGSKRRPTELRWIHDLARSVLDAQVRIVPNFATPTSNISPTHEGSELVWGGPSLHIKQVDVCESCGGHGGSFYDDGAECGECLGGGDAGKVRGKDPDKPLDIYVPGYGTRTWREDIRW